MIFEAIIILLFWISIYEVFRFWFCGMLKKRNAKFLKSRPSVSEEEALKLTHLHRNKNHKRYFFIELNTFDDIQFVNFGSQSPDLQKPSSEQSKIYKYVYENKETISSFCELLYFNKHSNSRFSKNVDNYYIDGSCVELNSKYLFFVNVCSYKDNRQIPLILY